MEDRDPYRDRPDVPFEEPTVLDYVKDRLAFWKHGPRIQFPEDEPETGEATGLSAQPGVQPASREKVRRAPVVRLPWGSLLVLGLALLAQLLLEPQEDRTWVNGVVIYLIAAMALVVGTLRSEWSLASYPADATIDVQYQLRATPLLVSLVCAAAAFVAFKGGLFNDLNLLLWAAALVAMLLAFRETGTEQVPLRARIRALIQRENWSIVISPWMFVVLVAFVVAVFFRVYRLAGVPSEMVSDHAEKLWDVRDVLNGMTSVFFIRNTGREFFQFYLTAAVIKLFNTGLSFLSLKIGTVTCGLLTLPFIYLVGKEVANRRVGLIAMAFAGIAYWPNVISRIALRFALYPFFYAPTLYFFLRGLRTKRLRDFILSGIFLGLGLNGYSPFRVVPIVLVVGVVIYWLHRRSASQQGARLTASSGLVVIVLISLILFIPLLRFTLEHPMDVAFRSLTRIADLEHPIPGNPWMIFLDNLWRALTMFGWDDGEVWVNSVIHRPALDVVSAALFHLGVVLVTIRYIRKRHWHDLFMLVSIPLLLMPSILSLAFPHENPSLNRAGGAIVPVFVIIGLALDGLMTAIQKRSARQAGALVAGGLALALFGISATQNYDLVFNQYARVYAQNSWNASEAGEAAREFADLHGTFETVYTVASPYWMDTRLVMINAGNPDRDSEMRIENVAETASDPRAKLFIVRHFPEGTDATGEEAGDLAVLRQVYPNGWAEMYLSKFPGKDFWLFFAPANPNAPDGG